jgi:uncharacterized membrane protein
MNSHKGAQLITGLGIGLGLMYLLDPDQGRRRRARAGDQLRRVLNKSWDAFKVVLKDVQNRARGFVAELEGWGRLDASDGLVAARPRPSARRAGLPRSAQSWSPTARFLAGTVGGALAVHGLRRGRLSGTLSAALGFGLVTRGIVNMELGRLIGLSTDRRAVDISKTFTIAAPVERVYEFWDRYENFPRFMRNVLEVRRTGENTSHWIVAGPAGVSIEWDALVTERVPNKRLSWATRSGSMIEHGGTIRFRRGPRGGTTVHLEMSYDPKAGLLGHAVASLFGADPKSEMDEDLLRMKALIEQDPSIRAENSSSMSQA